MSSEDNLRKVRLLMSDPTLSKTGKRVKEPKYQERPIHKLVLLLTDSNDDDIKIDDLELFKLKSAISGAV